MFGKKSTKKDDDDGKSLKPAAGPGAVRSKSDLPGTANPNSPQTVTAVADGGRRTLSAAASPAGATSTAVASLSPNASMEDLTSSAASVGSTGSSASSGSLGLLQQPNLVLTAERRSVLQAIPLDTGLDFKGATGLFEYVDDKELQEVMTREPSHAEDVGAVSPASSTGSATVGKKEGSRLKRTKDGSLGRHRSSDADDATTDTFPRSKSELLELFALSEAELVFEESAFLCQHDKLNGKLFLTKNHLLYVGPVKANNINIDFRKITSIQKRTTLRLALGFDVIMADETAYFFYGFHNRDSAYNAVMTAFEPYQHVNLNLVSVIKAGDVKKLNLLLFGTPLGLDSAANGSGTSGDSSSSSVSSHKKLDVSVTISDFERQDEDGELLIHKCVRTGKPEVLKTVLNFYQQKKHDVNHDVDQFGWTPLHVACHCKYANQLYTSGAHGGNAQPHDEIVSSMIKLLLDVPGLKVDVVNNDGNTPLHYFCQNYAFPDYLNEIGDLLIEKGKNVSRQNKGGETALHKAVFNERVRKMMVDMLIRNHCDVNVANKSHGETALHYSIRLKRKDLLRVLLGAGGDFNLKSKTNQTPLELAVALGTPDIADMLTYTQNLLQWLRDNRLEEFTNQFLKEELWLEVLAEVEADDLDSVVSAIVDASGPAGPRIRIKKAILKYQSDLRKAGATHVAAASDMNSGGGASSGEGLAAGAEQFKRSKLLQSAGSRGGSVGGGVMVPGVGAKELAAGAAVAPINAVVGKSVLLLQQKIISKDWQINYNTFEYTKKLGSGTSGKVYKGILNGKQKVAIKILKASDESALEEFEKEFAIMSVTQSSHIVRFFGACVEPKICMILEYCKRGSLYHVLSGPLVTDWSKGHKFMIELAAGMSYLHNCEPPIFHRDMKSLNVLITKEWDVKITDFGLARSNTEENMKSFSKMVGTIGWTAPELLFETPFTAKSDVYSTAIVLWEIVRTVMSGKYQQPYREYTEITRDFQIITQAAEKNLRPTIPQTLYPPLAAAISTMWHGDPEARPAMADVLPKLEEAHNHFLANQAQWAQEVEDYRVFLATGVLPDKSAKLQVPAVVIVSDETPSHANNTGTSSTSSSSNSSSRNGDSIGSVNHANVLTTKHRTNSMTSLVDDVRSMTVLLHQQ